MYIIIDVPTWDEPEILKDQYDCSLKKFETEKDAHEHATERNLERYIVVDLEIYYKR